MDCATTILLSCKKTEPVILFKAGLLDDSSNSGMSDKTKSHPPRLTFTQHILYNGRVYALSNSVYKNNAMQNAAGNTRTCSYKRMLNRFAYNARDITFHIQNMTLF